MVRVYEKYGWVLYLALGLLWLVVGFAQAFFPDGLLNNESLLVLDMSWSELEISPSTANRGESGCPGTGNHPG
ncbi:MAG: hypothetical protein JSV04_06100 [Candidatus Heimdallarchaeota archaeon]|nr:MAG: hypothetical protein JSV04_06100 [Candidatus Heimdallarchaeota archaeon]